MTLRRPRVYIILLIALCVDVVSAQGHRAGDGFVAVRAGANLVGNTYRVRERKPEPAPVVRSGRSFPAWALEFETWMRASNPKLRPRQREMLYSSASSGC